MGTKRIAKDRAMETVAGTGGKTMPNKAFQHYDRYYAEGSMEDLRFRFTSRLRESMRVMRLMLEDELRTEGLTRALWEALFVVALSGGDSTQKSLAKRLRIEGATLVRLLDRLEEDGLIERVQGVEDRRSKMIVPTRHGLTVVRRLIKRTDALRAHFLADWSQADLEEGIAMLSRLVPGDGQG